MDDGRGAGADGERRDVEFGAEGSMYVAENGFFFCGGCSY